MEAAAPPPHPVRSPAAELWRSAATGHYLQMSYSNHKRQALDPGMPLPHRMSHARSCAVHVSQKYRVKRSVIIAQVHRISGVDLMVPQTNESVERAIAALDHIRNAGVDAPQSQHLAVPRIILPPEQPG